MARRRVALADDHPVVRSGLRSLLAAEPGLQVVAEFDTLPRTRSGLREHHPDLLLLDLVMAGVSTLAAIPELLGAMPGLKIVVLTMHEDPAFAREALRLGASGYLVKDAGAEQLLVAVRRVLDGGTYLQPALETRAGSGPWASRHGSA